MLTSPFVSICRVSPSFNSKQSLKAIRYWYISPAFCNVASLTALSRSIPPFRFDHFFALPFHMFCHSFSFTIVSNTGSRKVWISSMTNGNSSVLSFMVFKKNFQRFCISSSSASATTRLKLSLS